MYLIFCGTPIITSKAVHNALPISILWIRLVKQLWYKSYIMHLMPQLSILFNRIDAEQCQNLGKIKKNCYMSFSFNKRSDKLSELNHSAFFFFFVSSCLRSHHLSFAVVWSLLLLLRLLSILFNRRIYEEFDIWEVWGFLLFGQTLIWF